MEGCIWSCSHHAGCWFQCCSLFDLGSVLSDTGLRDLPDNLLHAVQDSLTGLWVVYCFCFFLRFCRTWTERYLIASQTRVKRVRWRWSGGASGWRVWLLSWCNVSKSPCVEPVVFKLTTTITSLLNPFFFSFFFCMVKSQDGFVFSFS